MAEAPCQVLDDVLFEDVRHQPHLTVRDEDLPVGGHDARGFLSAVLQGIEPQVHHVGGFGVILNPHHCAHSSWNLSNMTSCLGNSASIRLPERGSDPGTGGFETRPYNSSSGLRRSTPLIGIPLRNTPFT